MSDNEVSSSEVCSMAKPVTVTIPHELGKTEARRRLADNFGSIRQQLGGGGISIVALDETWEGDRLHFEAGALGTKVRGHIDVHETSVVVEILLPRLLARLANLITRRVTQQGQLLLK
jgi:hypothetical protein